MTEFLAWVDANRDFALLCLLVIAWAVANIGNRNGPGI